MKSVTYIKYRSYHFIFTCDLCLSETNGTGQLSDSCDRKLLINKGLLDDASENEVSNKVIEERARVPDLPDITTGKFDGVSDTRFLSGHSSEREPRKSDEDKAEYSEPNFAAEQAKDTGVISVKLVKKQKVKSNAADVALSPGKDCEQFGYENDKEDFDRGQFNVAETEANATSIVEKDTPYSVPAISNLPTEKTSNSNTWKINQLTGTTVVTSDTQDGEVPKIFKQVKIRPKAAKGRRKMPVVVNCHDLSPMKEEHLYLAARTPNIEMKNDKIATCRDSKSISSSKTVGIATPLEVIDNELHVTTTPERDSEHETKNNTNTGNTGDESCVAKLPLCLTLLAAEILVTHNKSSWLDTDVQRHERNDSCLTSTEKDKQILFKTSQENIECVGRELVSTSWSSTEQNTCKMPEKSSKRAQSMSPRDDLSEHQLTNASEVSRESVKTPEDVNDYVLEELSNEDLVDDAIAQANIMHNFNLVVKINKLLETRIPRPVTIIDGAKVRSAKRFQLMDTASTIEQKTIYSVTDPKYQCENRKPHSTRDRNNIIKHFRCGFGFKMLKLEESPDASTTATTLKEVQVKKRSNKDKKTKDEKINGLTKANSSRKVLLPVPPPGGRTKTGRRFVHVVAKTDCGLFKGIQPRPPDTPKALSSHGLPRLSSGRQAFSKFDTLPPIQSRPVTRSEKDILSPSGG